MFYTIILISIGYINLINTFLKRKLNILFYSCVILITIIALIRYGAGTDYFAYRWHFYQIPTNIIQAIRYESHMDIGFRILISIFRYFNLNFEIFIAILSAFIMACYIYVIEKYSNNKMLSIFIFFSNCYLIYVESALRQGLAMSIFIVAYYKFIEDDNIKNYITIILVISLFHRASLICLIIPIIKKIYNKIGNNIKFNTIILLVCILSFLIKGDRKLISLFSIIGINVVYEGGSANILAILVRIILLIIMYISYRISNKEQVLPSEKFQMYTYFINVCIFIAVSNNHILSRITDFISIIEIIILANCISRIKIKGWDILLMSTLISTMGVLFIKDLNSNTKSGNYYQKGAFNYPYVSILDKDRIFEYREIKDVLLRD